MKHVLRNCAAPIMVFTVTLVADAIIFEASLTFLSAGIAEPTPTWGNILADARAGVLSGRWWQALYPGIAIMLTCLALNILSEGITDAMAAAPSAPVDTENSESRREADLLVADPVRAYKEQAESLARPPVRPARGRARPHRPPRARLLRGAPAAGQEPLHRLPAPRRRQRGGQRLL